MHTTPHNPRRTGRGARKLALAASAVAAFGVLAMPAVGQAATTFGSPLTDEPNTGVNTPSGQCPQFPTPCTRVGFRFPSANPQEQKAPVSGVVTKFRIRSQSPDQVTFRIARLIEQGTDRLATSVGSGPSVTLKGDSSIEQFGAQISIQAGDYVALDSAATGALHGGSGGTRQYQYSPPLVTGEGPRASTDTEDEELLLQAVIEPDSDKDGFGDETQDRCPTDPSTAGACPTPDTVKPILNGVAFAPGSFRAASKGGAVASRAPVGARVFYRLSETATVTWRIEKGTVGRRVGGRCVKKTRLNASRRRCLRFVRLIGSFKTTGGAGQNGFRFTGRLNGHKLVPGSYKLVGIAKDPAGNKSTTRKRNFRIVK
jgi:hypothetical protein